MLRLGLKEREGGGTFELCRARIIDLLDRSMVDQSRRSFPLVLVFSFRSTLPRSAQRQEPSLAKHA